MLECKKVPSLVDLCVWKWINNVWLLGDVRETDDYLLERMLSLCTADQLTHVEKSTKGRDLSPVTDKLWKKFYEKRFGTFHTNKIVERMRKNEVPFKWMQLFEDKVTEIEALEQVMRLSLYEDEDAYCGPYYNVSHSETEEEIDSQKSQEEEADDNEEARVEEAEEEEEEETHLEEEEEEEEETHLEEEEEEEEETHLEEEEEEEEKDEAEDEEQEDDGYNDEDDYGYDDGDFSYEDGDDYGDDYGYDGYDNDYDEF